jgi:hypothetical protein
MRQLIYKLKVDRSINHGRAHFSLIRASIAGNATRAASKLHRKQSRVEMASLSLLRCYQMDQSESSASPRLLDSSFVPPVRRQRDGRVCLTPAPRSRTSLPQAKVMLRNVVLSASSPTLVVSIRVFPCRWHTHYNPLTSSHISARARAQGCDAFTQRLLHETMLCPDTLADAIHAVDSAGKSPD